MEVRQFGSTDLRVSEFGLGCARIGGVFQGDANDFLTVLRAAHDAGINFFDTADMYTQGESETLIGRAFHGRRHDVVIASKAGYRLPAQRRWAGRLKPLLRPLVRKLRLRRAALPAAVRGSLAQEFSPEYLRRAVEGSLRRLRTDYLDILQLHSPPTEIVEQGAWQPALEDLKRAGKIRYYGVAGEGLDPGLAALRRDGVSSLQFTLNLLERRALDSLVPRARERGIGLIARECLANGILIKRPDQIDLTQYSASPAEAEARAAELARYRQELGSDPGELAKAAIKFVRDAGVSVTLLGVRSSAQLRDLLLKLPP
ncbi:MAG TPA: aldo/keto reductase [Polyangiaceae bacterium]|nr:aldo/keto reductase [Polyangiaceae bacterium]